jgi:L-fuculose-phosphate aldolase
VREEDNGFYIKRTGTYLDVATEPVFVPLVGDVPAEASSEYRVHREVYRKTPHRVIVHAHPQAAVALSLVRDEVRPEDSEGIMFCPVIPVVSGAPGSQEIADTVSDALVNVKLVIARGHGTFAAGRTLDEAYLYTSLAEHACRVLYFKQAFLPK